MFSLSNPPSLARDVDLPRLGTPPPPLVEFDFPFTHHRVTLAVFARPAPKIAPANQQWFSLPALDHLPVPSPHRRALLQLLPARKERRS